MSDERMTHHRPDPETLYRDADEVLDTIYQDGKCAVVGLDVAYAILAATENGVKKLFDAKNRTYEKPSGMFAHWVTSQMLHDMPAERHEMVREMATESDLPFSVVAPFNRHHPILAKVPDFVMESSSKAGTLDMLLNAGPLHDAIALRALHHGRPVFGSSANTSLTGSKYRLNEIDTPVLEAGDIKKDYGLSRWHNRQGRSSTIIDFRNFSVIRIGVQFDRLTEQFEQRFGVRLQITDATAGKAA